MPLGGGEIVRLSDVCMKISSEIYFLVSENAQSHWVNCGSNEEYRLLGCIAV
jgi:hypothetical protein